MHFRNAIALLGSLLVTLVAVAEGSGYGIYEDIGLLPEGTTLESARGILGAAISASPDFDLVGEHAITSPDHVRKKAEDRDGHRGHLFILSDPTYLESLVRTHPKYAAAGLMRIGLSEEPAGLRATILQPETLIRIVANDLEDEGVYESMAAGGAALAVRLRQLVGNAFGIEAAGTAMPPIRDAERLREGKKDMFMMVGPLTYFRNEGQFPLLYSEALRGDADEQIAALAERLKSNLESFAPSDKDRSYRWCPDPDADLRWRFLGEAQVSGKATLLCISRPRTEGLALHIAGMKRAAGDWHSPGLDHLCAFPVEVLIYLDGDEIQVRTAKQMFRMDQYFWDAGKGAFMKYASMPDMLDNSIERALLGK